MPIKCDELNEMDKLFLHYLYIIIHKRHKWLSLLMKKVINRPISIQEIQTVFKYVTTKKNLHPDCFTNEFCQILRKK